MGECIEELEIVLSYKIDSFKACLTSSRTCGAEEQLLVVSEGHDPAHVEGQHHGVVEILVDIEWSRPNKKLVAVLVLTMSNNTSFLAQPEI